MSNRRTLRFNSEEDVLVEVARLRHGYTKTGQWSLEQIAWHLVQPIEKFTSPPTDPQARRTPEQDAIKARFVDAMLATRTMPDTGRVAPPGAIPPETADDAALERFVSAFRTLKAYAHPLVAMGPVGPVLTEEVRHCHLVHAEHHLSFLEPKVPARREGLTYANEDACIADVNRLRQGCIQTCGWTLAQACWHLNATTELRMKPGPHPANTAEQDARRAMFEKVMSGAGLPNGLVAPDFLTPPADSGDESIDQFIATLTRYKLFPGPTAPHRLFGQLAEPDARRLNLIHCAHHLRYLIPS